MTYKRSLLVTISCMLMLWSCQNPQEQSQQNNAISTQTASEGGYTYEYVNNDPLKARIYTLKNGLKIYLSAYKDEPRIMTNIAVRAGGTSDPATNTGLAHYLEHMLFKGTDKLGTKDWEKEKVLLDSIENMFNHYATLTDPEERKAYYAKIDQVSGEASKLAIANEYDKITGEMGAKGTNAYTWYEQTVYVNDIPSNELERWLKLEADRFKMITPRLFHTELEAVYEEKNRTLDSDSRKAYYAMMERLFPKHQYGTQTVIGTIEHLKNPSITEIKNYFEKYYIPNNIAICLSGDLDYTATIQLIEKYFGSMEKKGLEEREVIQEAPLTSIQTAEVFGPDAERVSLGFRFPGIKHEDIPLLKVTDMILSNASAGLIDINLRQAQKVLNAGCSPSIYNDYSIHNFYGSPKGGQTLDEVKDLLLSQINEVKAGNFEDWMIPAVITDLKKSRLKGYENNYMRTNAFTNNFIQRMNWEDYVKELDEMEKVTKQDVIAFANKYYKDNYVLVYKRTGEDPNKKKVDKPNITPVAVNREEQSAFFKELLEQNPSKLQPAFLDYQKDINQAQMTSGIEVLHKENQDNDLFSLNYFFDMGSNHDLKTALAVSYLNYLGTDQLSAEELKKELYKLGASFSVRSDNEQIYLSLNGLGENAEATLALFENVLANAKPDQEALNQLIERTLKGRADNKKNKDQILRSALRAYLKYGNESPFTNILSEEELKSIKAEELTEIIKGLTQYKHRVLYYGPQPIKDLVTLLNEKHKVPAELKEIPAEKEFKELDHPKNKVYWVNYDMVQAELFLMSKGNDFSKEVVPASSLFSNYFGGGMSSIVFQEIRESKGLAYAAWAWYINSSKINKPDYMMAYIGTQADKLPEALPTMFNLINNLPESESAFNTAKNAILSKIESERITKENVLLNYESAKKRGLDYDLRKDVYNQVKNMTFEDMKAFHSNYIKDKNFSIVLVGPKDKLDFDLLAKYGEVKELSLEEVFGY